MSDKTAADRFKVEISRSADTALVQCHGELVSGVTDILYREVRPLIPESKQIVLDLKHLSYLDSAGLGMIMRLYISAKASRCDLELANIGARVRQILGLANLMSVLTVIGENNIRIP